MDESPTTAEPEAEAAGVAEPNEPANAGSSAPENGLFVFGAARELSDEERALLHERVASVGPVLSMLWPALTLRDVDVALVELSAGPSPEGTPSPGDDSDETSPDEAPEHTGPEWLHGLGGPAPFWRVAELRRGLGAVAFVVPGPLALLIVDVMLGGSGRSTGARSISAIDVDLLSSLVPTTFEGLQAALLDVEGVSAPPLVDEEPEVGFAALLGDPMTATFSVTVDESVAEFHLVLSEGTISALLGGSDATGDGVVGDSQRVIQSVLGEVLLETVVDFPTVRVPSRTVLGIDIGDVIDLGVPADALLSIRVADLEFGAVRPARSGTGLACQIVTTSLSGAGMTTHSTGRQVGRPGTAQLAPARVAEHASPAFSSADGGVL